MKQVARIFAGIFLLLCISVVWGQNPTIYAVDRYNIVLEWGVKYKPDTLSAVSNLSPEFFTVKNSKNEELPVISASDVSEIVDNTYAIKLTTTKRIINKELLTVSGSVYLNSLDNGNVTERQVFLQSFIPLFVPPRPFQKGIPYAWGSSSAGVEALNTTGLEDIVDIATTEKGSVYLKSDGTILFRGTDAFSETNSWEDVVQVSASKGIITGLKSDGSVYISTLEHWDNVTNGKITGWTDIVQLDCSEELVIGLCSNGKIKLLAQTEDGIVTDLNLLSIPDIIDVAVSRDHAFIRNKDNLLFENVTSTTNATPNVSLLSAGYSQAIYGTKTNFEYISNTTYPLVNLSDNASITATNVKKVDSGRIHNLFLLKNGTIQANGNSSVPYAKTAELEKLTSNEHITDIAAGSYHSIVLKATPITVASSISENNPWTWTPDILNFPWDDIIFVANSDLPPGMQFYPETGVLIWNPSGNGVSPGEYTFSITATSADAQEQFTEIEFTLAIQNSAPQFVNFPKSLQMTPGVANVVSIIATDSVPVQYSLSNQPAEMFIEAETGMLHWTPPLSVAGQSFSISVTASDGELSTTKQLTVVITTVNIPPEITSTPYGNSAKLNIGSPWNFQLVAEDNDPLTWKFSDGSKIPSGLTLSPAGLLSWTPNNSQNGEYEISVSVSDGINQTDKTFALYVSQINHAPVWTFIPSQFIETGNDFNLNLSAYASDADGDMLGYSISGAPTELEINQSTGELLWTCTKQNTTSNSVYTITVTASDGSLETVQSFTLSAVYKNNAPTITGTKTTVTINECENSNITSLLEWAFSDPDSGDTLSFSLQNAPDGMSVDNSSGTITWNPTETQGPETYTVTLTVKDSDISQPKSTSKSFSVTVKEVNAAPVLAPIPDQSVETGKTFSYQLIATDADEPMNTLTYSLVNGYPSGMNVSNKGLITWECTKDSLSGTKNYSITVKVSDGSLDTVQTFTLSAIYENGEPVINGGQTAITINECENSNITSLLDWTFSDPDDDTLSFSFLNAPEGMSINGSGVISWNPTETQGPGIYTATLEVRDSDVIQPKSTTQSFTVTVTEVNTASTFGVIPEINAEVGVPLYVDTIRASDNDLPPQTLTYTTDSTLSGFTLLKNGDILYVPAAKDVGTHTINITCQDNGIPQMAAVAQITICVTQHSKVFHFLPISDITVKEHENLTLQLTAIGSNETSPVTYSFTTLAPTGMTLSSSGLLRWCPGEADGNKSFTIGVQAVLGNENCSAIFHITVDEVNDAPIINGTIPRIIINEGTILRQTVDATDPEGDSLTYTVESVTPALSSTSAQPYFVGNVLTWPTSEADGSDKTDGSNVYIITVKVSDNDGLFAQISISVKVKEVNQRPIITSSDDFTAYQGTLFSEVVQAQDNDIPQQKISYKLLSQPDGLSIHPYSGILLWRVKLSTEVGRYPFTVEVTDENGGSTTKSFNIVVNPWNDNIVGSSIDLIETVKEDEIFEFDLSDPVKNYHQWFMEDGPEEALYAPETGILTWIPSELDGGKSFIIILKNKNLETEKLSKITIFVEVEETNEAPIIEFEPIQAVYPEQEIRLFITTTDSDIPEQQVTLSFTSELPQGASFDSATGEFTWRPTAKQLEETLHLFLQASDSEGLTTQKELIIPSYLTSDADLNIHYFYDKSGNIELSWDLPDSENTTSFDVYGISSRQHDIWQKVATVQLDKNIITLSTPINLIGNKFFWCKDSSGSLYPIHLECTNNTIALTLEEDAPETVHAFYSAETLSSEELSKKQIPWFSIDPVKKRFSYNARISESEEGLRSFRVIRTQK